MMLRALSSARRISSDRSGSQRGQFEQDPHVEEESFDGPVDDRQLGRLEGIEGCARVVRQEEGPVGQVPRRDRVRRRLNEELDRLVPLCLGGEHELAVLVVQSLDGPEPGVPDLALGGETDHLVAAEVDEGHHLRPGPRVRDRSPEPEPGGVPHAPPGVTHFKRSERSPHGLGGRYWLAVQVVGRHLQRGAPPVNCRANHRLQEPAERAGIVAIGPKSDSSWGSRPVVSSCAWSAGPLTDQSDHMPRWRSVPQADGRGGPPSHRQDCGSRACIGNLKRSRKVAASGTRHAHAVIARAWVGKRPSNAEKKIVPSTATPSALESCWTASALQRQNQLRPCQLRPG